MSIGLRAPSLERALAALSIRSITVVRAARVDLTLPAGTSESTEGEAIVMALDGASLADCTSRLAVIPGGRRVAWALPVARPGVVGWALARARRLAPVRLEDACAALRHAGVVDLQVTTVDGALRWVLLSGYTSAS